MNLILTTNERASGRTSRQPMHPVEPGDRRFGEKTRERHDQIFGITGASTVKPPGRCEYHPGVVLTRRHPGTHDAIEVFCILRDHGSTISSS